MMAIATFQLGSKGRRQDNGASPTRRSIVFLVHRTLARSAGRILRSFQASILVVGQRTTKYTLSHRGFRIEVSLDVFYKA